MSPESSPSITVSGIFDDEHIRRAEAHRRRPLGEILAAQGAASNDDVQKALRDQSATRPRKRLGEILLERGLIDGAALARALARQAHLPFLEDKAFLEALLLADDMPTRFFQEHRVVVARAELEGGETASGKEPLLAVLEDPTDGATREGLSLRYGDGVALAVAPPALMDEALQKVAEFAGASVEDLSRDIDESTVDLDEWEDASEDHLRDMASEAPVIRLVNLLVTKAVERRASDIHIELFEHDLKVRYRIDGVLHEVQTLPRKHHPAIASRVKLLAGLNIAERRVPQDGRIKLRVRDREVDLRIATSPTIYGENIVIRILDRENVEYDFGKLGFPEWELDGFLRAIEQPQGFVLVTGPTGSGKTTTLYTALHHLNRPEVKIITIEDPVEIRLAGINQIPVNPKIDLTFARGLRSILRQDPDVVMVGEIRDLETAKVAINAALTGHSVFSTLHTNDAAGAVARLIDMGMESYLVASSLTGILAQRLCRRLCAECRTPFRAGGAEYTDFPCDPAATYELFHPGACPACDGTGFRGRLGLYEMLPVDDAMRARILRSAEATGLRRMAQQKGMRTLRQAGWDAVLRGDTTAEEVRSVTQAEDMSSGDEGDAGEEAY